MKAKHMKHHDNEFGTMNEALKNLKERGYDRSFSIHDDGLYCHQTKKTFKPDEMRIVEFHRFEGSTDFEDMSIVYVLEGDEGTKGVVVDAFGTYADSALGEFLKSVDLDDGQHD